MASFTPDELMLRCMKEYDWTKAHYLKVRREFAKVDQMAMKLIAEQKKAQSNG